jgi:hypothetical protein
MINVRRSAPCPHCRRNVFVKSNGKALPHPKGVRDAGHSDDPCEGGGQQLLKDIREPRKRLDRMAALRAAVARRKSEA